MRDNRDCKTKKLDEEIGKRAEDVASFYFRLNGFFAIPGFILHPDEPSEYSRTDLDLFAVRFPFSSEIIDKRKMVDDSIITKLYGDSPNRILFILVEVKAGKCKINGPWSDKTKRNMEIVIRRMGFDNFENDEEKILSIAEEMYKESRWENEEYILQYLTVGERETTGLQRKHPKLVQITYKVMAKFFLSRFHDFPEKLQIGNLPTHRGWPKFGIHYGDKFKEGLINSESDSIRVIKDYIRKPSPSNMAISL